MPLIHTDKIKEAVYNLCVIANTTIEKPFYEKILGLYNSTGDEKYALILQNIEISHKKSRPLCQDTGQVVLFVKVGQNVQISGENLENALNNAVAKAYEENFYRKSVVSNAIFERKNTKTNTPAIIYTEISSGDEIEINLLVKGAGSENYGAVKMFNPADTKEEIFEFIKETIQKAGERACPPLVLGIGAGGTMDYVALLSKKAFFSPMSAAEIALKKELLGYLDGCEVLDAKILTAPTHIASLPVAVTLNCHCMRHSGCVISENGIKYKNTDYTPGAIERKTGGLKINTCEIEKIRALNSGGEVLLSGEIYTARDAAHARIKEMLENGQKLPLELKNKIIFYAGPCPAAPDEVIGPIGPTTSARMDKYTDLMLKNGVIAMIGKGERSKESSKLIKSHNARYFTAYGGIASLLAGCVKNAEVVAFEDLGAEAVFRLEVENLPLKVNL